MQAEGKGVYWAGKQFDEGGIMIFYSCNVCCYSFFCFNNNSVRMAFFFSSNAIFVIYYFQIVTFYEV